ncbi:MAG: glycosyltransferase family 2 protein [Chloroflexi bacterium]|nr:glycosyltransferase family 2 protein [Chloroflexota bacterium]
MNCSVVIPVYRGEATLIPLVERLTKVLPTISTSYEVILVNDGSPDKSWAVIEGLAKQYLWVRGIDLMRNYGQHNATLCGVRSARYEVIFTMDDDLQNLPEEMPKLIAKLNEGYDVVYGVARKRQQGWFKNLVSVLLKRGIAYVMRQHAVRDIGAFKAFRANLRKSFESFNGPDVLVDVLLSWGTNRFASVIVEESPRVAGKSNYNLIKLIKVSLLVLTSYTTLPLRFASIIGFVFTVFGFFVLAYVLTTYFSAGSIQGFPFLASIIAIFSGVQLFALGIMGEYLARLFERSSGRKTYAIGQITFEAKE